MAYTPYDVAVPTTAQTRQAAIDSIRTDLAALRDALAATGIVQGFNYSVSGGTADQPAQLFYKRGVEWIRVDVTWGTTGGEDGNPTVMAFYYSPNSGVSSYGMADAAGKYTVTISYDTDANVTGAVWS